MEAIALDTTFLIDLQNEKDETRRRGGPKGAAAFLRANPDTMLQLPVVALAEYLEGFDDPEGEEARSLVAPLRLLPVTTDVALHYATVTRALRASGRLIDTNDLWIACTARAAGLPILTRNVAEFRRVPHLQVVAYAELHRT
jgi:tRNA(fMet)-specific endonuclease VapC